MNTNRRNIMKLGLVGAISTLVVPSRVFAAPSALASPLAGAIFYTHDKPGRWAGKEGAHTPMIERDGATIEVTTGHPMDGYNHYIVKHIILDRNLGFVREVMFDPMNDSPVSRHDISGLNDLVYAVSLCNKHDAWLNALEL